MRECSCKLSGGHDTLLRIPGSKELNINQNCSDDLDPDPDMDSIHPRIRGKISTENSLDQNYPYQNKTNPKHWSGQIL